MVSVGRLSFLVHGTSVICFVYRECVVMVFVLVFPHLCTFYSTLMK
jgi:hypothetical protein